MRKFLVSLATIWVTVYGQGWSVNFTEYPDNKSVQLVTECRDAEGKLTFWAVNEREINATSNGIWFPFPRGARKCHHTINLVRFGDDPTQNYVAERYQIQ